MNEKIIITNEIGGIVVRGDIDWVKHSNSFAVLKEVMLWLEKLKEVGA